MDRFLATISDVLPIWNTTRAAGLTSYVLLFVSMVAGMLQSFSWIAPSGRKMLNILHQSSGWFGLLFGMVHGFVLFFDQEKGLSLKEIFVPFAAHTRSLQIGLGIIALYMVVLVMATSDWMKQFGRKVWRSIHYLSFPAYLFALAHGVLLGPDTQYREMVIMYVVTAGIVVILFVLRMTQGTSRKHASFAK